MTIRRQRRDELLPALKQFILDGIRGGAWRVRGDHTIIEAACLQQFNHAPGRGNYDGWRKEYAEAHGLDYTPLKTRKRTKRGPGRPKDSKNRTIRTDNMAATFRANGDIDVYGPEAAVTRVIRGVVRGQ